MRLLLLVNRVPAGGAEKQLLHLAFGLAEHGHRVTLCCVDSCDLGPAASRSGEIEVVELGDTSPGARLAAIPRLTRMARAADVVHCTMWDPSLWGRIAAILARRPAIVADHATDRSKQVNRSGASRARWIALHNRLLDRFTFATVACATAQRPVLIGEGVRPEKIAYIPNGIPVAEEAAAAASSTLDRAGLGLREEGPVVLQVGRFQTEKNQLGALETLRAIREQLPATQLAFLGDGPMRAEVEAAARALGVRENCHFLGYRDDVPAVIALADITLLPSIADAMPMAVLESMAVGVPVLASDVGDVREVIGEGGATVPAGDSAGLSRACLELLSDPARRSAVGEAARRRAAEFDSALMVDRYQALFEAAIAKGSPQRAVDLQPVR